MLGIALGAEGLVLSYGLLQLSWTRRIDEATAYIGYGLAAILSLFGLSRAIRRAYRGDAAGLVYTLLALVVLWSLLISSMQPVRE
jgi:hypothetical protein